MLCYITCYCGLALDDVYPLFRAMKIKLMREKFGDDDSIVADDLPITTEVDQISLNPIFEALGIYEHCCRAKLMGVAEFAQLLK